MSGVTQALANPFEATAPEEDVELRALSRSLRFAQGFRLFFARSQDAGEQRRLVEALAGAIPSAPPLEIDFDRPINHLLDELRRRFPKVVPPFISVWGLERSLPRAAEAHDTPLVANLNAARDSFPQLIPCPLVLWVQPYVLTAIARGAPDFFSIRSGVYDFVTARHHPPGLAVWLASATSWEMDNLSPLERNERVNAISELLARYQVLPPEQRDRQSESRLLNRLGNLLHLLGKWSEAEPVFLRALEIDQEVGDRISEGATLDNLGNVYGSQGRWEEAIDACGRSLAICREFNDRAGEGLTLMRLGNSHFSQNHPDKALDNYQRSLAICRELPDRIGEGRLLNNLGVVSSSRRRWDWAVHDLQLSLAICRKFNDLSGEGVALNNIGGVYGAQSSWEDAEDAFFQSLAICRKFNDRAGEGQTLINLAILQKNRGEMIEARAFAKQGVDALKDSEAKAELAQAYDILTAIEVEMGSVVPELT